MTSITIKDYPVKALSEGEGEGAAGLHQLFGGKKFVIDFWTTKCVRCPAALDKLNVEAEEALKKGDDVIYVSCALDNEEIAAEIVEESESWGSLVHVFMDLETKEQLKKDFSFSEVPFCIVGNGEKHVLGSGNPKNLDIPQLLQQAGTSGGALNNSLFTDDDF